MDIFLVRTPLGGREPYVWGGPLRVRVGRRRAYAGFRSEALARRVCRHWGIRMERVHIEPWPQALAAEAPEARLDRILVFRDREDFERYLRDPQHFPYDRHIVGLHPTALDSAVAEAASHRDVPGE